MTFRHGIEQVQRPGELIFDPVELGTQVARVWLCQGIRKFPSQIRCNKRNNIKGFPQIVRIFWIYLRH